MPLLAHIYISTIKACRRSGWPSASWTMLGIVVEEKEKTKRLWWGIDDVNSKSYKWDTNYK